MDGDDGLSGLGQPGTDAAAARPGALAYVFGHRFGRLDKRDEAVAAFRTALGDGAPGSPLCRLARAQIDRLAAKAPAPGIRP